MAVLKDSYIADDNQTQVYGAEWSAQTFTPASSYTCTYIDIIAWKTLSPAGNFTVSIRATSAGLPTGSDLNTSTGTIACSSITGTSPGATYQLALSSGVSLTSGTVYAIVYRATSGDASNFIDLRHDETAPAYAGGTGCTSSDSGSTWATFGTARDFSFATYANTPVVSSVMIF